MGIKSDWYLVEDNAKAITSLRERIETLAAVATKTTIGFEPTGSRKIGGLSRCAMICSIAATPKEKRKVFVDRYVKNMSLMETARANGVTKQAVCKTLKNF